MSLQQKDHKPTDQNGQPKTRCLMNAKTTANQRASDMLNDILTSINNSQDDHEMISTEEFLFKVEGINSQIREGKINGEDICIGSLDVENSYGSIDTEIASQLIREDKIHLW